MAEKYRPRTGDRVRVTVEGTVTADWLDCDDDDGFEVEGILFGHTNANRECVSIEPIHTEFAPGDYVRWRSDDEDRDVRLVGRGGYFNLADATWYEWGQGLPRRRFTSEFMERVSPSELE